MPGPLPPVAINGATGNGVTPIVLSTSVAHGFQSGDQVQVTGVVGNTAANSAANTPWTITVTDSTHFSVPATGNGAYTSGGLATDFSFVNPVANPMVVVAPQAPIRDGLRDFVKRISVGWLASGVAEMYLYAITVTGDALIEKMNEAMQAHLPGLGDSSTLPIIGADRVLTRGLFETDASYGLRLSQAYDTWPHAGSALSVLRQILAYLSPLAPMVRLVTGTGNWTTFAANAPTTSQPGLKPNQLNWTWDALTSWWRGWTVIYSDSTIVGTAITGATNSSPITITTQTNHGLTTGQQVWIVGVEGNLAANSGMKPWTVTQATATTFTLNGSLGSAPYTSGGTVYLVGANGWVGPGPCWGGSGMKWGDTNRSWGLNVPATEISALRAIVNLWKGAHTVLMNNIVSFDATYYDPAQASGTKNPDGNWGTWAKTVAGVSVPSRNADSRFCDGSIIGAAAPGMSV